MQLLLVVSAAARQADSAHSPRAVPRVPLEARGLRVALVARGRRPAMSRAVPAVAGEALVTQEPRRAAVLGGLAVSLVGVVVVAVRRRMGSRRVPAVPGATGS